MPKYKEPKRVFTCPYCKKDLVAYNQYNDQWTCENKKCVFGKHAQQFNSIVGNPEMWGCVEDLIKTINKVIKWMQPKD